MRTVPPVPVPPAPFPPVPLPVAAPLAAFPPGPRPPAPVPRRPTRRARRPVARVAGALAVAALAAGPLTAPAPAAAARRPHAAAFRPPVDAPVVDPFRAPACTWCPGNRGLAYAPTAGQPVVAAAAGRVTFAGTIAGVRWVTVEHPDGLRTSYGHLAEVAVRAGRTVAAGEVLGAAGETTHFGVRRGDTYLDPAPLLAGGAPVPRLVPLSGGPSPWPRAS